MASSPTVAQTGTVRQDFSGTETKVLVETSSTAVAAKAKAMIEAQYIVAMRNTRDLDNVRIKMLAECERPAFAKVAIYSKPVGGSRIEGPSVRFAEALRRCMLNMATPIETIYDDDEKRLVNVCVIDLESNNSESKTVTIQKTLLRKNATGYEVLGQTTNTKGERLFIVRADDDALLNKENALISKAKRNAILALCPGDIIDEAMEKCRKIIAAKVKEDPDAERKAIADGFAELKIMPADLKEFLGCELNQLQPAELVELRKLYTALRDGEVTWRELKAQTREGAKGEDGDKPEAQGSSLRDRVAAARKQQEGDAPKDPPAPTETQDQPKTAEAKPTQTDKPTDGTLPFAETTDRTHAQTKPQQQPRGGKNWRL